MCVGGLARRPDLHLKEHAERSQSGTGGRSQDACSERLFRFWFPERPGATARFLTAMGADWNISLFHYRTQGGDFGRVLVGLEIPPGQESQLQDFLDNLGYRYVEESANEAYQLFL